MITAAIKRCHTYARGEKCKVCLEELTCLREVACPRRRASQKLGVLLLLPRVVSQQTVQRCALLQLGDVEGAVLTQRRNQGREEHGKIQYLQCNGGETGFGL